MPMSPRFGNLDTSVSYSDAAIGELRVKSIENSLPGSGQFLTDSVVESPGPSGRVAIQAIF